MRPFSEKSNKARLKIYTEYFFCGQFYNQCDHFLKKATKQIFLVFLVATFRHSAYSVSTGSRQIEGSLNPSTYMARPWMIASCAITER
jgi:hypothetical protein